MDTFLFTVILVVAVLLLILSIFRKQYVFGFISGILFMILGVMSWNGFEYVSSQTITLVNENVNVITYNYSTWNHTIASTVFTYSNILGTSFVLIGLFIFFINIFEAFSNKKANKRGESGDHEEVED